MTRSLNRVLRFGCILAALYLGSSAQAIQRYKFQPLTDLGFGGVANGAGIKPGQTVEITVVGHVKDSTGNRHACAWRSSHNWATEMLPDFGLNSSAFYTSQLDTGTATSSLTVVGSAQTPDGSTKPIVWRELPGGSFTPTILPTLAGQAGQGEARFFGKYVGNDGTMRGFVGGSSQNGTGDRHATLWLQTPGGFQAVDLGTLGGAGSEAMACTDDAAPPGDFGSHVIIVGRAQIGSGAWHACSWEVHNDGEVFAAAITDQHPGGAASVFTDCAGPFGSTACGTAIAANGRSMAFGDPIGNFNFFSVPNANNTAAYTTQATLYGGFTVGAAWNDRAVKRGVVWNTIADLGTHAYPVSALADHPLADDLAFINAAASGVMAGFRLTIDGLEVPCVFIADDTQLADRVAVTMGIPENSFRETALWHPDDGDTLRIRTRNQDGDRASVEASFFLNNAQDGSGTDNANIRARLAGGTDATAQADVSIFNNVSGQWDNMGSQNVVHEYGHGLTFSIPAAGYQNPVTGEVRIRVILSPLSGKVRGYEIDMATLTR